MIRRTIARHVSPSARLLAFEAAPLVGPERGRAPVHHFKHHGLDGFVDAWALSYERGWVKPEPEVFLTALRMLDLEAGEAVMVGDRAGRDGGAATIGIPTLLLPPAAAFSPRGLDLVLRLFIGS